MNYGWLLLVIAIALFAFGLYLFMAGAKGPRRYTPDVSRPETKEDLEANLRRELLVAAREYPSSPSVGVPVAREYRHSAAATIDTDRFTQSRLIADDVQYYDTHDNAWVTADDAASISLLSSFEGGEILNPGSDF